MKTAFFILGMLVVMQITYGQGREIIELWPMEVPGEEKPKDEAQISDDHSGDVIRVAEVTNPVIEVFEADNPNGAGVIVCPGGGYHILAIDKEGYEIAEWLNQLGYTAFVLQYRVPEKQAGALMDIQRAIRLVRNRSDQWSINPDRLGVIGFSAGGSLAARASTRFYDHTYPRVDEVDRHSARPDFSILIYPAYLDKGPGRSLTPELTITEETPPVFIFATADDKHANSSLVMGQALMDRKVPVELHLMPEGGHGYALRAGTDAASVWPELAEDWLEQYGQK